MKVRADDFPVEAGILQPDGAVNDGRNLFSDRARARELHHADVIFCYIKQFAHLGAGAMNQVHVGRRQTGVDKQAKKLLENDADFGVDFD